MTEILIVIPAREAAQRLPGKPLADILGEPMIVHVWRRAMESDVGKVVVATDSEAIISVVEAVGGEAILTRSDHVSGSDRVFEAVEKIDPDKKAGIVVNLQGDLPTLDPTLITSCVTALQVGKADIATIASEIVDPEERVNPNVVKIVGSQIDNDLPLLRAIYFTRATAPYGEGPLYHHIGIYAYLREALARFISLPPSALEVREKLEQLRAIEEGLSIFVALVDTVPLGVDTPADLERARQMLRR